MTQLRLHVPARAEEQRIDNQRRCYDRAQLERKLCSLSAKRNEHYGYGNRRHSGKDHGVYRLAYQHQHCIPL